MEKQFKIKSFDDLIEFIENEDASPKEIEHIISTTMRVWVWVSEYKDKRELIEDLKTYWNKWKNQQERPIFIVDLDIID